MLAVWLTFDRLPWAGLGCYGNEWIDTPSCDALASEGWTFERVIVDPARHPYCWGAPLAWLPFLEQHHLTLHFLTTADTPAWELPQTPRMSCEVIPGNTDTSAVTPREWTIGRWFRRGLEWLHALRSEPTRSRCLWMHTAGLPDPCFVPHSVEDLYLEEFAERGIDWTLLSEEQRREYPLRQACFLTCWDHLLGEFCDGLRSISQQEPVLLLITAASAAGWIHIPRRDYLPIHQDPVVWRVPALLWTNHGDHLGLNRSDPYHVDVWVNPLDFLVTTWEWFTGQGEFCGAEEALAYDIPQGVSLWPVLRGMRSQHRAYRIISSGILWNEDDVVVVPSSQPIDFSARRYLWPEDVWCINDVANESPAVMEQRLSQWQSYQQRCLSGAEVSPGD